MGDYIELIDKIEDICGNLPNVDEKDLQISLLLEYDRGTDRILQLIREWREQNGNNS